MSPSTRILSSALVAAMCWLTSAALARQEVAPAPDPAPVESTPEAREDAPRAQDAAAAPDDNPALTSDIIADKARLALLNDPAIQITCLVTHRNQPLRVSRIMLLSAGWRAETLPYHPNPSKRESLRCVAWRRTGEQSDSRLSDGVAAPTRPMEDIDDFWRTLGRSAAGEYYDAPEEMVLEMIGHTPRFTDRDGWIGQPVREPFRGVECWRIVRNDIENAADSLAERFWIGVEDSLVLGYERDDYLHGGGGMLRATYYYEPDLESDPALIQERPPALAPLEFLPEWRSDAERLYDTLRERYATFDTYSHSTAIRTGRITHSIGRAHLRADDRFRFEFASRTSPGTLRATRSVVWRVGDQGGFASGLKAKNEDAASALEVIAGIASVVPPYAALFSLLVEAPEGNHLAAMSLGPAFTPRALGGEAEVDGRVCRALLGFWLWTGDERENDMAVWVDVEQRVVRRIDYGLDDPRTPRISLFVRPRLNEPIADEVFQREPPGMAPLGAPEDFQKAPDPPQPKV